MSKKRENKIEDINQLLAMAGSNLNILEEEVDVTVQKQYFALLTKIGRKSADYQQVCQHYVEHVNDLFDETVEEEEKKKMLVVLATVDDIAIYRAIENFSKQITPLQKWAVIALQQSRMLIQSTLLDDPGVYISTGLGGHGTLLRYFCVFVNRQPGILQEFQQLIVRNESEAAITNAKGSIESIEFLTDYNTMLILLPIDTELQPLFSDIITECNQYGNFLHENMIITNVKKLSDEEIQTMLHTPKRSGDLPS